MLEEKKILLGKIDELITKKKSELLKELPDIHEIDDGIIIRFFTEWDNCEDDDNIKFKIFKNIDIEDESVVFFYLPKNSYFDLSQRFFIGCMTCLNGKMEIIVNQKNRILNAHSKICVNSDEVQGKALENTYLITTSNRSEWSDVTHKHVKTYQK